MKNWLKSIIMIVSYLEKQIYIYSYSRKCVKESSKLEKYWLKECEKVSEVEKSFSSKMLGLKKYVLYFFNKNFL